MSTTGQQQVLQGTQTTDIKRDIYTICVFISTNKQILYIIPYQVCFGLYSSFVSYYVNTSVVADHIGIGYIGIFSALATITACLAALPCSYLANRYGKPRVMVLGALCFATASGMLVAMPDNELARFGAVSTFYILYGVGRSVWENTNKSVIADYFKNPLDRDMAYATVYFASGFSGAMGYLCYQYMSRSVLVIINLVVPIISFISYLYGDREVCLVNSNDLRVHKFNAVLNECFDSADDVGNSVHTRASMNPIRFPALDDE